MATELTTSKSFQDKMFEKIKEQMGDLLTAEDLKKMVDAAMQQAFFEPVIDRSGYNAIKRPPEFISMIEELMQAEVNKVIKEWIAEHPELITKTLTETLEKGMFKMALNYFESKTQWPLTTLMSTLQQKGIL